MRTIRFAAALLLAMSLLYPRAAVAQAVGSGTISGTVKDSSGAAIPGVTVEAASPALIEGRRVVVTDSAGRYSVINLRPGTYTVTFSLDGFSTIQRQNIQLTSDFTANVNAELTVGAMESTIVVDTRTPLVDVQSVAQAKVYTREVIDQLPSGRTPNSLLFTIPGTEAGSFGLFSYRGSSDSITTVDGMRMTNLIGAGPGSTTAPTNSNMYQEFSFSTNIDSAEFGQPGMRINLVPREGGNELKGTFFARYTRGAWQGNNIDDDLRAQGVTAAAKSPKQWDINPGVGGPILRDKLWFYLTYQNIGDDTVETGSFYDADPLPYRYVPDQSRPGISAARSNSIAPRLTWQATPSDNVAGYYERFRSETPLFYSAQNRLAFNSARAQLSPEATTATATDGDSGGVRWTRTQGTRLLFETSVGGSVRNNYNDYRGEAAGWSARHLENGVPGVGAGTYVIGESSTNQLLNVAVNSTANLSKSFEIRSTANYVTGSHTLRAGVSFFRGSYYRPESAYGSVVLQLDEGVPNQAVLTLPTNRHDNVDGDFGLFVQDRWTINRLTVNAGLRMDWLKTSVPDQVLPASVWLPEQQFAGRSVVDWKDFSPRLGLSYDLFGTGRTAVKVAAGRFVDGETIALTGQVNPMNAIATTDNRAWNDVNGDHSIFNPDGSVQENELGPTGNSNFGTPVISTTFDDDVLNGWFKRGYSWQTDIAIQHQLLPRVAVTAMYYRRWDGNNRVTDDLGLTPDSFDGPFCVDAPDNDDRLPNAGQQVCGLYDIKPQFRGRAGTNQYVTFADSLGVERQTIFSGYELTVNARLGRGAFVTGGVSFAGQRSVNCDVIDDPEDSRFCNADTGFRPDVKISGSYPLPLGLRLSGTYRMLSGPPIGATWRAPNSVIQPGLGRRLAACPPQGACRSTKSIALIEPNSEYLDDRHTFDLRLSKAFAVGPTELRVNADLYNAFNSNGVQSVNTTFSTREDSSWLNATGVQDPRQLYLSMQLNF